MTSKSPLFDLDEMFAAAIDGKAQDLPDLANETLGEYHVPLAVPFNFREFAYLWAPLRFPTGRDWRAFEALPANSRTAHAWLVQILAAPVEILDVMHAADYLVCLGTASKLLGKPGAEPTS